MSMVIQTSIQLLRLVLSILFFSEIVLIDFTEVLKILNQYLFAFFLSVFQPLLLKMISMESRAGQRLIRLNMSFLIPTRIPFHNYQQCHFSVTKPIDLQLIFVLFLITLKVMIQVKCKFSSRPK